MHSYILHSQDAQGSEPGAVIDILEHPSDQGTVRTFSNYVCLNYYSLLYWQLLLGYSSGLVVLWTLADRKVDCHYYHDRVKIICYHMMYLPVYVCTTQITSLCWISSGKEFATSNYDGTIKVWSVKNNRSPQKTVTPHGTYV